jgi:hypothetical protein
MKKLLRYYQALEGSERSSLRKFIESPIHHNEHNRLYPILPLFDALDIVTKKMALDESKHVKSIDYEILLFKKSYPTQTYNKLQFSRIHSELVALIEDYLTYQAFQRDDLQKEHYRFWALHRTKLKQDFIAQYESFKSKHQSKNANEYYIAAQTHELYLRHHVNEYNSYPKDQYSGNEAFTNATLIENIRLLCFTDIEKRDNLNSKQLQQLLLQHARSLDTSVTPVALQIYLTCYDMITDVKNQISHYAILEQLLLKYVIVTENNINTIQILNSLEVHDVVELAAKTCTKFVNQGKKEYAQNFLFWRDCGITHGFLMQNDAIRFRVFKSIITDFINLEKFDNAERFIEEHSNKLEKAYQTDFVNFLKALVYFRRGNFEAVGDILSYKTPEAYNETSTTLDLYIFATVIYLNKDDRAFCNNNLNNFDRFLKRKKIKTIHYQNLIQYARKINGLKHAKGKNREKQQSIFNDLSNPNLLIAVRPDLIKIMAEIMKK